MTPSLSDDEIEDRFFLLGRMEILNVLNDLIHRRETLTVYFNGGSDFIVTTLLEARQDGLVFDLSGDEKANRRLPRSSSCVFVGRLDGVRVQFSSGQAAPISWGGADAFEALLPERVVRLQRRESYRILLPVAKPMMVKLMGSGGKSLGEWPGHDLSVGGVGLTLTGTPEFDVSELLPLIVMEIPMGRQRLINCSACVRHITPEGEHREAPRHRIGLSFENLPPATGVAIQRYIIKIELERRGILAARGGR
ncbi:MAG: flagellar brake protein [Paucimonas sp.]|nr:flagellar brake protein [Paucimonas sp.]